MVTIIKLKDNKESLTFPYNKVIGWTGSWLFVQH